MARVAPDSLWHRDAVKKGHHGRLSFASEAKTPYAVEELKVVQRRLPEGVVLAQFGPFASAAEAEQFLVRQMQIREGADNVTD